MTTDERAGLVERLKAANTQLIGSAWAHAAIAEAIALIEQTSPAPAPGVGEAVATITVMDWFPGKGPHPIRTDYTEAGLKLPSGTKLYAHPSPVEAAVERDAVLLDFMIESLAWIRQKKADSGSMTYWLETQDENEEFHMLSGTGQFFRTPREAIEAAARIAAAIDAQNKDGAK